MKFEKQTYTQTPNSLFLTMKDMDECELKVVMLICRYTFGYHRDEVKLSTRRIADEIGMNTASVQKGADRAVERGLIEKVIDGNKTTLWRALVSDSENESQAIQKLNRGVSDNESLSRVKESNKEKVNNSFQPQGIEQKIWAGLPVTQSDIDDNTALDAFQMDLQTPMNWVWYPAKTSEEKTWKDFREFIKKIHKNDSRCFAKYQTWRTQPYARGAMSNLAIKRNPENFPLSWSDFLASSSMYGNSQANNNLPKINIQVSK